MKRNALVVILVLVASAFVGGASASQLAVQTNRLEARDTANPCAAGATAEPIGSTDWYNPGYAGLEVTLPSGCDSAQVAVSITSGSTLVTSGAAAISGSGTVPTGVFTDPDVTVLATANGWNLPVAYSYTLPATCRPLTGSGSCAADVTLWTGQRPGGSSEALYFDVVVTTTSSTWVRWEVTFDLTNPYYGVDVVRLGNSDLDAYTDASGYSWSQSQSVRVNDVHRVGACGSSLKVEGDQTSTNNNSNFRVVRAATPRQFSLVVNRTETGYSDVLAPGC